MEGETVPLDDGASHDVFASDAGSGSGSGSGLQGNADGAAPADEFPDSSLATLLVQLASENGLAFVATFLAIGLGLFALYYVTFKAYYMARVVNISPRKRKVYVGDTLQATVRAPRHLPRERVVLRVVGADGLASPPPLPPPALASAGGKAKNVVVELGAPKGKEEFQIELGPLFTPGQCVQGWHACCCRLCCSLLLFF